jgi:hypothetical protein
MPPRSERSSATFLQRVVVHFGLSGPAELVSAALLVASQIALLVINVLHRVFDSDEPQHLHVIWGWTRGLVQYRDIFDNHMPLFHIALAPIFGIVGEHATAIYWMRFILLPTFFISAWCTYQISGRLFSRRVGVWSAILLGFYAKYQFHALQFRTDNLWVAFWLLSLLILVTDRLSVRRVFLGGFLLGFCFGVSMKSVLFLVSLVVSAILTIGLASRTEWRRSWTEILKCGPSFFAGTAIIPASIMIFFASKGVWRDFRYGVFQFNLLANRVYQNYVDLRAIIAFPIALCVAWWIIRVSRSRGLGLRRAFVLITCAAYLLFLQTFWKSVTDQDFLPLYPLLFVIISGGVIYLSIALENRRLSFFYAVPLPAFAAAVELSLLVRVTPFWPDKTREHTALLRSVLALTKPSDYVLDCKGETIFRPRPVRFVIEKITEHAIARGLLNDDTPQRCIETGTCVVATIMKERFSATTERFVEQNYLPVTDDLRVAGLILKPGATDPTRAEFQIVIPAWYKLISRDAKVSALVDGTPFDQTRFLAAGRHTFKSTEPIHDIVLLWAQAVDRQFTPFGHL